jgi:hypothetical protein
MQPGTHTDWSKKVAANCFPSIMDWWKGNHAIPKTNNEVPSKTTRKYVKSKNKVESGSTNGQSTMLAFVENKDLKSTIIDPSEIISPSHSVSAPSSTPDDSNPINIESRMACILKIQGNKSEPEQIPNTPSVKRVTINECISTGSDANKICNLTELPLPVQEPSDFVPQVLFQIQFINAVFY